MARRTKLVLGAALVVVDLVSAALTFRDLRGRDESQIRGSKRFWRIATIANPGNSLAYWLFGRRTRPTAS
ncbi:MAG TPA: hypothetical protein VG205_00155 [Acidimicrobiales bacterium]|jgi:hypothetical protein|nr:hypothetical protein [Acidimicrobiales bacterium]